MWVERLVLLLVLGATFSEAHLKLFYLPWQMPIRNAPSSVSDGIFSAAANQPCGGGNNQWARGNQRRYARVVDGQKVCARVNWNGGHSTTTNENKLRAVFRCNRPDNQVELLEEPELIMVDGTFPEPQPNKKFLDAKLTNALYDGYTVCVNLPVQNITGPTDENNPGSDRQCTLSIMEGNSWGGCHDLLLYPNDGTVEPLKPKPVLSASEYQEVLTKVVNLNNSEGTYEIKECFVDTGGKCCVTGFFGVRSNGAVSARFMGGPNYGTCFELSWGRRDYQMILKPSKFSKDLYEANFYLYMGYDTFGRFVTTQNMSLTMRDGGALSISNVGLDIPEVSDHSAIYWGPLESGLNLNLIPWPNYSNTADLYLVNILVPAIVGGLLLIYLVGGVIYSKCHGGPCEHPHIHAVLVGLGCVRKRRKKIVYAEEDTEKAIQPSVSKPKSGFSLQLPPNWSSAVDQMSGEVYYYNSSTKETRWERPT